MIGLFINLPEPVAAHPGNTDSRGCHTCRTNCTESWGIPYGFYHTHINGRDVACGNTATPAPAPVIPRDTTPPLAPTFTSGNLDVLNGLASAMVSAESGSTLVVWSNAAGTLFTGRGSGGPQLVTFRVPEGSHQITFTATDAAGNKSRPSAVLPLSNPPLSAPTLRLLSKPGRLPLSIRVGAMSNVTVWVAVGNSVQQVTMPRGGEAQVTVDALADGEYTAAAEFTDGQSRKSPTATLGLFVDATPPSLVVNVDKKAARRGRVAYSIATESGARVTVRGEPNIEMRYTAGASAIEEVITVGDGRHELTFTAKDASGNKTFEKRTVTVTS